MDSRERFGYGCSTGSMGAVFYNLVNSARLGVMAPAPIPGVGGFVAAAVPAGMAGAGTYIIVNTTTNNRYVGIANNIHNRFANDRLPTICEMGFAPAAMNAIGVTWGATTIWNTPAGGMAAFGAPTPAVVAGVAPAWPVGGAPAVPAPPAAYTVAIDAVAANVNLEQLLIRFLITQLGGGGTVSNNALAAAPYVNPTANPIMVRLAWGAMGGLFAPGYMQRNWVPGAAGAW